MSSFPHTNYLLAKFKYVTNVSGTILHDALKLDSHLPKKCFYICFNESPLKLMKNAFYFILKALFVLKIFKFLSYIFVMWKKRLNQKDLTTQPGQQTITIHILPKILRSKVNQTLKFGQAIEYNNKYFSSKIMQKRRQGDQFQTSICFIKKLYMK